MNDCIFCKIVKGEVPSKKVYEDSDVLVFENINPVCETHLIVIPKKHIPSFLEIKNDIDLFQMVRVTQKIIKDKKIEGGYKLAFNGGKYQAVPHLHWHLLAGDLEGRGVLKKI
jgi:histidine triad (HIT) family protein